MWASTTRCGYFGHSCGLSCGLSVWVLAIEGVGFGVKGLGGGLRV